MHEMQKKELWQVMKQSEFNPDDSRRIPRYVNGTTSEKDWLFSLCWGGFPCSLGWILKLRPLLMRRMKMN